MSSFSFVKSNNGSCSAVRTGSLIRKSIIGDVLDNVVRFDNDKEFSISFMISCKIMKNNIDLLQVKY